MEMDNLKSAWQEISPSQKEKDELHLLLKKNSYPILVSIKKQIVIESLGFTAFLFCHFTMFDGASKSLAINLTIIAAIVLQLFYGYKGFLMQSSCKSGSNLKDDLESFVKRLRSHRLQVVLARIFFATGLLIFFIYNISFSYSKWWILAFIIMVLGVQLALLYRLWSNRINKLEATLAKFKNPTT